MHTADRFQGRDKEVVVLSLVRSNEACSIGELLRDWRRINVAFTRAKTKLLVVGSRATLRGRQKQQEEQQQEEGEKEEEKGDATIDGKSSDNAGNDEEDGNMLARFVALMEERDWVYDLPADALESHRFEHFVSQDGSSGAARSPRKTRADGGDGHEGGGEQKAAPTKAGPDALAVGGGKENSRPAGPKKARVGSKVLLKGRPILRDVLNEMMDGTY
ncbi:hypothetical protein VTK73DRAFT_4571 [Phialemonium thermophilum]|uniref:DNA replication ATP-dependent helicase/nuclease n=1 Tax=Phialemonium thermophilum TaxID=223376 RepID=A0ABR3V8L9_9PEZI